MTSNLIKKIAVLLLVLLELQVPASASPQRLRVLKGHVIGQIQQAARVGPAPADEPVALSLMIQIDQDLMNRTLKEIYGPPSNQPRRFLSSQEFAQKFGLAGKRKRLKDFAETNGLTVTAAEDRAESMMVKVSGRADVVEKVFNVRLNHYQGADGKRFRAHETDPMVPEALLPDVSAVLGLSNLTGVAHPHLKLDRKLSGPGAAAVPAASSIAPQFAGSFSGAITPSDIKTLYGINPATQDGTGQTVAIFELDGYNPADIAAYEAQFGLSSVPLTFVGVDGTTNLCGGASCATQDPTSDTAMVEVAMDIELVAGLVPNATRIYVYDGPNTIAGVANQYDRIATDNLASVVSTSWGLFETANSAGYPNAEAPIFQRMATQGQAVFAASGDDGAYDGAGSGFPTTLMVDDPASQPYVTGVGGTTLTGTPSSATETAWDGGGGGVSAIWSIPSYQSGVPGLASASARNVPDVALNADPTSGYAIYVGGGSVNGGWFQVAGTSAAAPLWTALMALVNQYRASVGNGALGFANPTFYQIGTSGGAANFYNDITVGDNQFYSARSGYDNATGWGSFRGSALIAGLGSVASFATLYNLSNVYAYPNPWDVRRHPVRQMTIANVPGGASVKIFTVSGFLVKTLTASVDHATWDLTNDAGRTVASGMYIYMVTNNDKKIVGKLAIIK